MNIILTIMIATSIIFMVGMVFTGDTEFIPAPTIALIICLFTLLITNINCSNTNTATEHLETESQSWSNP